MVVEQWNSGKSWNSGTVTVEQGKNDGGTVEQ